MSKAKLRPASEVARDVHDAGEYLPSRNPGPNARPYWDWVQSRAAAVVEQDRREVVEAIAEWMESELDNDNCDTDRILRFPTIIRAKFGGPNG